MTNAERPQASLAHLLCAISFAAGAGIGQLEDHGLKSAYIGLRIAEASGLPQEDCQAVFYGTLVKDAGCTACAPVYATFFAGDDLGPRQDILLLNKDSVKDTIAWFWRHAPDDGGLPGRIGKLFTFLTGCRPVMKESMITHCEVGELFARRLGLSEPVQRAVRFAGERWDGKGMAFGSRGTEAPIAARIIHLSQVTQVAHCFGGVDGAESVARERRGTEFDPDLVGTFLDLSTRSGFWSVVEQETAQETVLAVRPPAAFDHLSTSQVDAVCEVLADFADIKARTTWNHSPMVADAAVRIGRVLGLSQADLTNVRRAALVHDLGKAAIPVGILEKGAQLSEGDSERFRLHPYYTERILTRVEPLKDLAADAASHHEAINGRGYHRRLAGDQISLNGRILALADVYATRRQQESAQVDPDTLVRSLRPLIGSELDPTCYEALVVATAGSAPRVPVRALAQHASDLTDRQVEVLQLVSVGLSNHGIAQQLVISEKTVEHHLENIFNRLGVSCRTAAVVFAVHQGLVA